MPRSDESFGERLRKIPLWQWGLIVLAGAMLTQAASLAQPPARNAAEAAGRGAAILLFVVVGVVLIVLHFVLPQRGAKAPVDKTPRTKTPRTAQPRPVAETPGLPPRRRG